MSKIFVYIGFFLLVCTINGKLNLCAMLTISESKIINCITNLT